MTPENIVLAAIIIVFVMLVLICAYAILEVQQRLLKWAEARATALEEVVEDAEVVVDG